jgi:hypothetical protein
MLEKCKRTLGPDHDVTIHGIATLAQILLEKGDIALAKALCQQAFR